MSDEKPETPIQVLTAALREVQPFATEDKIALDLTVHGPKLVAAVRAIVEAICEDRDQQWKDAIDQRFPAAQRERIVAPGRRRIH
jgi:hypothetical protein